VRNSCVEGREVKCFNAIAGGEGPINSSDMSKDTKDTDLSIFTFGISTKDEELDLPSPY
jgi:hypothetical protein